MEAACGTTQANADQLYRLSAKMSTQNTYAAPKSIFTVRYIPPIYSIIILINKHWLDISL